MSDVQFYSGQANEFLDVNGCSEVFMNVSETMSDLSGKFAGCSLNPQQPSIDYEQHEDGTGVAFWQQLQWCIQNDLQVSNSWKE